MKLTRTRRAMAALAAAALASVALAGPIQAQPGGPEPDTPPVDEVDEGFVCGITLGDFEDLDFEHPEGEFEDWTPTAEELAEINAETDALVKMLADNGITVQIETDEYGFTYPTLDDTTNDATWDLVDQYYEDLYGNLEDIDFDDCELATPDGTDEPGAKSTEEE